MSGDPLSRLGAKSNSVPANLVNTMHCTTVGMTLKVAVSTVLEWALPTCIERTFEGASSCRCTATNLSFIETVRKLGASTASAKP